MSISRINRSVFIGSFEECTKEALGPREARGIEWDFVPSGGLVVRERILFVCTANIDRSRTAEDLYEGDERYEVRSAGTAPFATVPVNRDLLLWADRVFVMCEKEDRHQTHIKLRFPGVDRPVVDLNVEDRWRRGHPELVARLLKKLKPHLGEPRKPEAGDNGESSAEG
jgi:predicted protein tyrosine phosphatase